MLKNSLILLLTFCVLTFQAQKVGVVLSGGGALGFAHIGALKALEENGIPVDYITGTSAGALVGSMYCSGWSPALMDSMVLTDKFQHMSKGELEKDYDFYFHREPEDANWLNVKFSKDFQLKKIIPTSFINASLLDFESMLMYSPVTSVAKENFDSLFIPFRCIAADVQNKQAVVFSEGKLNQAVRASMTYPGYLRPIQINDVLMFDGGLYNNFPSDVMYDDFYPDIIIGVNFTDSTEKPKEDDVFSQIKTMILDRNPTTVICENGILIEPEEPISIFSFADADKAVVAGYKATMEMMDSIKILVTRRVSQEELNNRRKEFRSKLKPFLIEDVEVEGNISSQSKIMIRKSLMRNDSVVDPYVFKKRMFWWISDAKINSMYTIAEYNELTGRYTVKVKVYPQKPFTLKFGGVFSSKPINTGFLGLSYSRLGKLGLETFASSYFGKYYGSVNAGVKLDFNSIFPWSLKIDGTISRWDYFRSFATFFEESRPSFIIENERFAGVAVSTPVGYFGDFTMGYDFGKIENNYYQIDNFSPSDTSDATSLKGHVAHVCYEQSSLNKKQFANEGGFFSLTGKYFLAIENSVPGSTSPYNIPVVDNEQRQLILDLRVEKYLKLNDLLSLGVSARNSNVFTESYLDNYNSTLLASPIYQPTLESRTFLDLTYADHHFTGLGAHLVYSILDNIDLRVEGFVYQPYLSVARNDFNQPFQSRNIIGERRYIGSSTLVFHSPIGPVSAMLNYYEGREQPFSFLLNFGYIIHNKRLIK